MRHWVLVVSMSGLTSLSCRGEPFRSCSESPAGCAGHSVTLDAATPGGQAITSISVSTGPVPPASSEPVTSKGDGETAADAGSLPSPSDDSVARSPASTAVAVPDAAAPPLPPSLETSSATSISAPPVTTEPEYTFGESLITNGDFSDGDTLWAVERPGGFGNLSSEFEDETLCLAARSPTQFIVGWPDEPSRSLVLPAGRYRFSFRVRGSGVRLWAKVGHAYEPYNVLFEAEWYGERAGWHDVAHEFTFDGDDAAGVAFTIELNNNNVCFDTVALQRAIPDADAAK